MPYPLAPAYGKVDPNLQRIEKTNGLSRASKLAELSPRNVSGIRSEGHKIQVC